MEDRVMFILHDIGVQNIDDWLVLPMSTQQPAIIDLDHEVRHACLWAHTH